VCMRRGLFQGNASKCTSDDGYEDEDCRQGVRGEMVRFAVFQTAGLFLKCDVHSTGLYQRVFCVVAHSELQTSNVVAPVAPRAQSPRSGL
jgi:hypothetical protein